MIQHQEIQKSSPQMKLPELRPKVVTKDGQVVDTTCNRWVFRASSDGGRAIALNWPLLQRASDSLPLSDRAIGICKLYLAWRLGFSKGETIHNDFRSIRSLLVFCHQSIRVNQPNVKEFEWHLLDEATCRSFLAFGMKTSNKGNDFCRMRKMYRWGAFGSQLPDFDRNLSVALTAVRATGNIKGAAVRFRDPVKGPFDGAERKLLLDAIREERGDPKDRVIVMLHMELGTNPQASARLKNEDLTEYQVHLVDEGRSVTKTRFHLAMPRVKKRTADRQTRVRPISRELGDILMKLRLGGPSDPLLYWLQDAHLMPAMKRFAINARLISPRTGTVLSMNPRRFRYTLATLMADEGASPVKIADVLDHTDLQNVSVYIEASSNVVDQVGQKFDEIFEATARHFRGKVVASGTSPAFPGIPPRTIPSASFHLPVLPVDIGGIGMCGRNVRKDGLCQLAPPLTCYPCDSFAAFRTGPHAEVLKTLETVLDGMKGLADTRILRQLEGVVAAIRQLIRQIATESKGNEEAE